MGTRADVASSSGVSLSQAPQSDEGFCPRRLPALSPDGWRRRAESAREAPAPLFGSGVLQPEDPTAWSLERLTHCHGDEEVNVALRLPPAGKPYSEHDDRGYTTMRLRELVERVRRGEPCYLHQVPLERFSDLAASVTAGPLLVPPVFGANLWVGARTASGLHYDDADNLFVQLHGEKNVILIAPRYTSTLRPHADTPSKSQLDLAALAPGDVRQLRKVEAWKATVGPGDVLYIPRGWWHHVAASGASVSLNIWHGARLSSQDHMLAFVRAGPRVWSRVAWDFLWSGLLRQRFKQRMFSPPPLGVQLYGRLLGRGDR